MLQISCTNVCTSQSQLLYAILTISPIACVLFARTNKPMPFVVQPITDHIMTQQKMRRWTALDSMDHMWLIKDCSLDDLVCLLVCVTLFSSLRIAGCPVNWSPKSNGPQSQIVPPGQLKDDFFETFDPSDMWPGINCVLCGMPLLLLWRTLIIKIIQWNLHTLTISQNKIEIL